LASCPVRDSLAICYSPLGPVARPMNRMLPVTVELPPPLTISTSPSRMSRASIQRPWTVAAALVGQLQDLRRLTPAEGEAAQLKHHGYFDRLVIQTVKGHALGLGFVELPGPVALEEDRVGQKQMRFRVQLPIQDLLNFRQSGLKGLRIKGHVQGGAHLLGPFHRPHRRTSGPEPYRCCTGRRTGSFLIP
jgi:hypothetical protein